MEFSIIGILAVVLELFRPLLLPLGMIIAIDVIALAIIVRGQQRFNIRGGIRSAALIGAVVALGAVLYLPRWTGSSLAQLESFIDYLGVLGGGIGVGVAVALLLYPLLQLTRRKAAL